MDYGLLVVFEVLIVNLLHTNLIVKKRYSGKIVLSSLVLFSFVLMVFSYFIGIEEKSVYRYVIMGFTYSIPIYILYVAKFKKVIIVMMYCFIYTIIVNTTAIGLASFAEFGNYDLRIFLFQTGLFIITMPLVYYISKIWICIILENAKNKLCALILALNVALFSIITMIRYNLEPHTISYFIFIFLVTSTVVITLDLLYLTVKSNLKLIKANNLAYRDSLTGIDNRLSLFIDMDSHIRHHFPFLLLFLDLDNLKKVNDTFSHEEGDKYLSLFASTLDNLIGGNGKAYRFAGDEFVCIISRNFEEFDVKHFKQRIEDEMIKLFEYNGVSVGSSSYPEDGDEPDVLINIADTKMYGNKNSSKKIRQRK